MVDQVIHEKFIGSGLAQRAMEAAQRANERVDGHERLCAERYQNVADTMDDVLSSLRGLWKIILITGGTLIVGMAGILAHQIFH